jgi:hypothetical protein
MVTDNGIKVKLHKNGDNYPAWKVAATAKLAASIQFTYYLITFMKEPIIQEPVDDEPETGPSTRLSAEAIQRAVLIQSAAGANQNLAASRKANYEAAKAYVINLLAESVDDSLKGNIYGKEPKEVMDWMAAEFLPKTSYSLADLEIRLKSTTAHVAKTPYQTVCNYFDKIEALEQERT